MRCRKLLTELLMDDDPLMNYEPLMNDQYLMKRAFLSDLRDRTFHVDAVPIGPPCIHLMRLETEVLRDPQPHNLFSTDCIFEGDDILREHILHITSEAPEGADAFIRGTTCNSNASLRPQGGGNTNDIFLMLPIQYYKIIKHYKKRDVPTEKETKPEGE